MSIDPVVAHSARGFLAALFLLAVLHKLVDVRAFVVTLRRYVADTALDRSPAVLRSLAALVIGLEAAVAFRLTVGGGGGAAALLAAGTLSAYGGAMLFNIVRGNTLLDCGCSWSERRQPVTLAVVARNGVLAILSLSLAIPVADRALGPIDAASIVVAICVAGLLYTTANQMLVVHAGMREG